MDRPPPPPPPAMAVNGFTGPPNNMAPVPPHYVGQDPSLAPPMNGAAAAPAPYHAKFDYDYEEDEEDDDYDYVVDKKALRDKNYNSSFLMMMMGLIGILLIFMLVWLGLIIKGRVQNMTNKQDASTLPSSPYAHALFPFVIPSAYLWGGVCAGTLGVLLMLYYAFTLLRQKCGTPRMVEIASYVRDGARDFLHYEYSAVAVMVVILFLLFGFGISWRLAGCYLFGVSFSAITGYIGMSTATRGSVRTAHKAIHGVGPGLNVAFRAGAVMGVSVVANGLLGVTIAYLLLKDIRALAGFSAGASTMALFARVGGGIYTKAADVGADLVGKVESDIPEDDPRNPATIADNVGDNVGDVAGMGADLFESYVSSIIATCILGASLPYFANNSLAMCVANHLYIDQACGPWGYPGQNSYAYRVCTSNNLYQQYPSLGNNSSVTLFVALPILIGTIGVLVACLCTLYVWVPKRVSPNRDESMRMLLLSLRLNIALAGILVVVASFGACFGLFGPGSPFLGNTGFSSANLRRVQLSGLPDQCGLSPGSANPTGSTQLDGHYTPLDALGFTYPNPSEVWWKLFLCLILGLVLGILVGLITEYFTSSGSAPTQTIAQSGQYGPGAVVIQGLGVGMLSTITPLVLVGATILGCYNLFSAYGVSLAAVGMLSTLGITMATDAYGPVADNAGGIAEMAELDPSVRDTTDALDALGNTTAAVGKGFSNASAVLTAYALLTALVQDSNLASNAVDLTGTPTRAPSSTLSQTTLPGFTDIYVATSVFLGIMLPFVFGALTVLAVSRAAQAMIVEVRRQFHTIPGLREGRPGVRPDHKRCIKIATTASITEMIAPGLIAILSPLVLGFGFGQLALISMLLASIGSGYMLGIFMANSGGAWDNAKKLVETGYYGAGNGKGSQWHKATVAGDTVGDPFKDTSGPAMNILIKLMTTIGLVSISLMRPYRRFGFIGFGLLWAAILASCALLFLSIGLVTRKRKSMAKLKPSTAINPPKKVVAQRAGVRTVPLDDVAPGSAFDDALAAEGGVHALQSDLDVTKLHGLRGYDDMPTTPYYESAPRISHSSDVLRDSARDDMMPRP